MAFRVVIDRPGIWSRIAQCDAERILTHGNEFVAEAVAVKQVRLFAEKELLRFFGMDRRQGSV